MVSAFFQLPEYNRGDMKLLIAEDEQRIARSLKQGLEQEGYQVSLAFDGQEALWLALAQEFDLAIFDIMMPKMSGIELTQELRSRQLTFPILFLSAKSDIDDRVNGLDCGADDYLVKPFAFDELLARVRALSRRPPLESQDILRIADLELVPQTFRVFRAGKEIPLSSKEFALLEFFIRNQGKVLSKQKIIEKVWDFDSDILPNTVEVFVRHLRQKIDDPFPHSPSLFQTVRGFGYRMEA